MKILLFIVTSGYRVGEAHLFGSVYFFSMWINDGGLIYTSIFIDQHMAVINLILERECIKFAVVHVL